MRAHAPGEAGVKDVDATTLAKHTPVMQQYYMRSGVSAHRARPSFGQSTGWRMR
jgi:hypothetical protein